MIRQGGYSGKYGTVTWMGPGKFETGNRAGVELHRGKKVVYVPEDFLVLIPTDGEKAWKKGGTKRGTKTS